MPSRTIRSASADKLRRGDELGRFFMVPESMLGPSSHQGTPFGLERLVPIVVSPWSPEEQVNAKPKVQVVEWRTMGSLYQPTPASEPESNSRPLIIALAAIVIVAAVIGIFAL